MQSTTRPLKDLSQLADGAVQERFKHELSRVLENIYDVNTEATKPRSITIKVVIIPSKERRTGEVKVSIEPKLQPLKPMHIDAIIGPDENGELSIAEWVDPQTVLPLDEVANVTPLRQEEAK